jgi:signal recognition particle subunit SEC65
MDLNEVKRARKKKTSSFKRKLKNHQKFIQEVENTITSLAPIYFSSTPSLHGGKIIAIDPLMLTMTFEVNGQKGVKIFTVTEVANPGMWQENEDIIAKVKKEENYDQYVKEIGRINQQRSQLVE